SNGLIGIAGCLGWRGQGHAEHADQAGHQCFAQECRFHEWCRLLVGLFDAHVGMSGTSFASLLSSLMGKSSKWNYKALPWVSRFRASLTPPSSTSCNTKFRV